MGASVTIPFVGGATFSAGVSYENGEWDAGVLIQSDVPVAHAGKMLGAATVDLGYQTGDFQSNKGALSQSLQVGAGKVGVSVSGKAEGGFDGASLKVGPQLGVSVSGQQSRTISLRHDVVPWVDRQIDRINQFFK